MHPIAEYAAAAYRAGAVRHGAPPGRRLQAGTAAAMALACEYPDSPRILELAIDLGQLEGLWAVLFQRREDLIRRHTGLVAAAWRDVFTVELIAELVAAIKRDQSDDSPDAFEAAAAAGIATVLGMLPSRPTWTQLRRALADALAAGQAEGAAAATVLVADRGGAEPPDWDDTYDDALTVANARPQLWNDTAAWAEQLLARIRRDLTRALVGATPETSAHELGTLARHAAWAAVPAAVAFITDWAMTSAAGAGSLAGYVAAGQTQLRWATAGDGRVCATCEDNESNGPYAPIEFPTLPVHPGCRCQPEPA